MNGIASHRRRVIVYEDHGWQRLLPLVYVRAMFQLVCGMTDLLSKVQRVALASREIPPIEEVETWCREGLAEVVAEQTGLPANRPASAGSLLLVGRGLWTSLPEWKPNDGAWVGIAGKHEEIVCIAVDDRLADRLKPAAMLDQAQARAVLSGLPRRDVGKHLMLFDWPWEIVLANERQLIADWQADTSRRGEFDSQPDVGSHLLNSDDIHIGKGTRVKPTAVIDAEDGPVWIGDDVKILPHTYIQGPAMIGNGTLLQAGAAVRCGTTIGPRCKVGGEIEGSIIHGFSNKQHDGFLGHSYIGSWVNIAADCINSDLKNTYGTVRVPICGREVDSGEMFVGLLVGDHSKTGINVSFPTGAVMGFCSSVVGASCPKFVPSFAWIENGRTVRFDEQRGLAIARKVMSRRQRTMSPAEEQAFLTVRKQALAIEHQSQRTLEEFDD